MRLRVLVVLLITVHYSLTAVGQDSISIDWLKENVQEIDFSTNTIDLSSLRAVIGNKRIVAIGEQTHMDGTAFEIRSHLIKFLMEEMDFDVVLFESGMFDMYVGNEKMQNENSVDSLMPAIYDFWKGRQCKDMYNYFQTRLDSEGEFQVGGFDMKLTSPYGLSNHNYTNRITKIFRKENADILQEPNFKSYIDFWQAIEENMQKGGINRLVYQMDEDQQDELLTLSRWVCEEMEKVDQPFWARLIRNQDEGILAYSYIRMEMLDSLGMQHIIPANNRRDELMASNLTYLLNEKFANNKVIIIGATYHFIRNNDKLDDSKVMDIQLNQSTIMGHLVYPKFKDEMYVIGFTAFEGEYGSYNDEGEYEKVMPVDKNSLEYVLASNDYETALVSLENMENEQFWKNNPSIRLFDYESNVRSNSWDEIIDAIFFSKEMKPIEK